jgi:beta-1,4-mannosyl-glycoprotein beta-1,4-N-acetylglucosaminyltransferase
MQKIFDCFTFYNEADILEFRLQEYYDVVDKFVLVESNLTHNFNEKELYWADKFSKEKRFQKYLNKIDSYVFDGNSVAEKKSIMIENDQRKSLKDGCLRSGINIGDLIIVGDVDEIYRKDKLIELLKLRKKINKPVRAVLFFNKYFVDLYILEKNNNLKVWPGPWINTFYPAINFQQSRDILDVNYNTNNTFVVMKISGWHLSSLVGKDWKMAVNKFKNYLHHDCEYEAKFINDISNKNKYYNFLENEINNGELMYSNQYHSNWWNEKQKYIFRSNND